MAVDLIAGGRTVTVEVETDEEVALLLVFEAVEDAGVFLRPSYLNPTYLLREETGGGSSELEIDVSGFGQGTLRFRAGPFLAQVARVSREGKTKVSLKPENASEWGLEQ